METYVTGKINMADAGEGSVEGIIKRLTPVGYDFMPATDGFLFVKTGRIEAVISEMTPVCENHGLDVEDLDLREYRNSDNGEQSKYDNGKIIRD